MKLTLSFISPIRVSVPLEQLPLIICGCFLHESAVQHYLADNLALAVIVSLNNNPAATLAQCLAVGRDEQLDDQEAGERADRDPRQAETPLLLQ